MDRVKLYVLVAEDNPAELKIFEIAAQESGLSDYINLHTARNGEEVIGKLEKSARNGIPFHLLILDLNMPRLTGFDVMKHIKDDSPSAKPIIIVLTNSNNPSDINRSKVLGADLYLQKPALFRGYGRVL